MRTLSILAFSDSKALAQGGWDTRLVGAAQAFGVVDPALSHGDALEALGILTNPSSRLIGGDVALVLDSGTIDLAALGCGGFSISEDQARRVRSLPGARALLEVENLSCFHELCRDPVRGVLVVYGEGFATNGSFSRWRGRSLAALRTMWLGSRGAISTLAASRSRAPSWRATRASSRSSWTPRPLTP